MSENYRLKRFDEIFRMMLLVITVTVSVGSFSFENINLSSSLYFILFSLVFWMIGHAIGSMNNCEGLEALLKLEAWAFSSFVGSELISKYIISSTVPSLTLIFENVIFYFVITILSSIIAILFLKKCLSTIYNIQLIFFSAMLFLSAVITFYLSPIII